jgi:Uma2 family endonuclease
MPPTETAYPIDQLDYPPLPGRKISEQEFVDWLGDKTWAEWVKGEIVLMSPINRVHSELFVFLIRLLSDIAELKDLGRVHAEPMQVRLSDEIRRSPDILFVSRPRLGIIEPTWIEGPPDLVIEIVSPSSVERDWREKYLDYQAAGVREYWVIDPMSKKLSACRLDGERYTQIALVNGRVASNVVPGFAVDPNWLWREPLPTVAEVLRELGIR